MKQTSFAQTNSVVFPKAKKLVSVVVPAFNEEKNISVFHERLTTVIDRLPYDFEIIFVNDGSRDHSLREIKRLMKRDERVDFLDFSRNFGKEVALTAGMHHCRGSACLTLDADLQHSVQIIPEFLRRWERGYEVIIGVRKSNKGESLIKQIGSLLFYKIINRIANVSIKPNATDFRLIDRIVLDEFDRFTEKNRMTRALIDWLGFRRSYIYFHAGQRLAGQPSYDFWKLFRLALNSFVSLSLLPLKMAGYLGIFTTFTAGSFGFYLFVSKYFFDSAFAKSFSGPAQLAILIVFLVGIILISLGLIALYIANIHGEVIGRPMYVIRERGHRRRNS